MVALGRRFAWVAQFIVIPKGLWYSVYFAGLHFKVRSLAGSLFRDSGLCRLARHLFSQLHREQVSHRTEKNYQTLLTSEYSYIFTTVWCFSKQNKKLLTVW